MSVEITDTRAPRVVHEYEDFRCLLDRILVRRVPPDDADFAIPDKYRQHSNWGDVIAIGDSVVLGQQRYPLTDFVNLGDRVRYGEYTAEQYSLDDEDLFIIRIQDVRGVRRLKK